MIRRLVLFILMLAGFVLALTAIAPGVEAQGYPYSGRVVRYFNDCNKSRVLGMVLDEQGNPVREPVVIRLWREGGDIGYRNHSGTHTSDLTGPSGWDFNIHDPRYGPWTQLAWYGTFYVTVVDSDSSSVRVEDGWLAEPVRVTTELGCGPESKNAVIVEFRLGSQPTPDPAPAPTGSSGVVVPVADDATCRAFTQTAGDNGQFRVCDDGRARFLTTFDRYGLQAIGYPISQRYERDGFVTQAFQKAILQWRADSGTVAFVNVFDDLHAAGLDARLREVRQVPPQLPSGWDGTADFPQIMLNRQSLMDEFPALRRAYFGVSDPMTFFGLPTSDVTDMGNHYAVRTQRAVLQEWKEDVPWARAGQVTIANGGDIAKEMGGLPAAALVPEPLP